MGSEYRRDVTSGTCELCIAEWAAAIRDISFELTDINTDATWETVTPILHVGPWNDIWEVWVNPFALSTTLPLYSPRVAGGRPAAPHDRTRIALEILEAVERLDRASAMVDGLDGAYIHDDDWDEEQFILVP